MKNSEYWEKRVANKTWNIYNSLEEKNRNLMNMYKEASLDIEEELFKISKKIGSSKITLSDMHKYNRLTRLKENMKITLKELATQIEKNTTNQITKAYLENYSNVMNELGGIEFAIPHKKLVEELMKFPWSGQTFSNRLWENTRVLSNNLNEILTRGLIQGKTIVEMANELEVRMMKGFNESHRLVRTEAMHYLNESSKKAYEDRGIKKIQIWAAVDERTCSVCGSKHGNIYNSKDVPPLPLHANCRCTILPVVDNEISESSREKAKDQFRDELGRRSGLDNGFSNKNRKMNIPKETLKHSNEGDFTNPRNPKKIKEGEIRLKSGGHGEDNIKLLEKRKIEYNIIKEYSNGVRCGNVPNHKEPSKKSGLGQVWFPKNWTESKIRKAAEYVSNLKDKNKYTIQEFKVNDEVVAIYKFANYEDITVCVCYNTKLKKVMTIFPDGEQRMKGVD